MPFGLPLHQQGGLVLTRLVYSAASKTLLAARGLCSGGAGRGAERLWMAQSPLREMSWPPWVLHFSLQPLESILSGWSHRNCIFDINSLADSSSPTMSCSYLKLITKCVADSSLQALSRSPMTTSGFLYLG